MNAYATGPNGYPVRTTTAEDLYRAQCRRDNREPSRFEALHESVQRKYQDAAVSGRGTRLESWHGDHTDLVHVIWDHNIQGEAADRLASAIRGSVYDAARRAHDQVDILARLEDLILAGADPEDAIETLKNDLIGEAR